MKKRFKVVQLITAVESNKRRQHYTEPTGAEITAVESSKRRQHYIEPTGAAIS
jgi:hypothetical protein